MTDRGAFIKLMPHQITFLHLSDLQFGKNHRFGPEELLKRLQEDLALLREKHGLRPDVLAVTGDLAEWGKRTEFADALDFLVGLWKYLALDRDRVVLVPGNHDVNRRLCESYFMECEEEGIKPLQPYWPKLRYYDSLFQRFYRDVQSVSFTEAEPWTFYEMTDLKLVVAGLNSTMAESHRDDEHYGYLGKRQLEEFRDKLKPYRERGWLRIGAVHHNVLPGYASEQESLRDHVDLKNLLGRSLNLILHGHTHAADLGSLLPNVPILSTGSTSLDASARPDVPNQYQVIRVEADRICRWCRQYAPDKDKWIADPRISEAGDDWKDEHKIAFADIQGTFPAETPKEAPRRTREDPLDDERRVPHDDLLARVERICRLREPDETEVRRVRSGRFDYLSVTSAVGEGIFKDFAVAAVDHATPERFEAFLEIHRRYRHADSGVVSTLVYAGDPAPPDIVERARRERVRLRSFIEYQGLVDFRPYVERQTLALAKDPIYPPDLYVEQRLRYRDREDDALPTVRDWLFDERGRFILVLGDFGTGKTFLLRELARRLGEKGGPVVPVLIELRALEKSHDLDVLLASHLVLAGMDAQPEKIRYMLKEGRLALLFDGFDELALRVSYDRALDHFATLAAAAQGNAKVVVTSRTQHFESDRQVRTVLGEQVKLLTGHRIVYLQGFDKPRIRSFLKNQLGDETAADDRFRLLDEVKDLMGLSENPRMLGFISELSDDELRAARSEEGDVTAASLYQALLDKWLGFEVKRQEPRGAPLALTREQRWDAVTHLAMCLWERTAKHIHVGELDAEVQAAVEVLAEQRLSPGETTHQVASGTLLVRDDEGRFSFIHQSVLEWLVARQAAREVREAGASKALRRREMSPLMADFFFDLAGEEAAIAWTAATLSRPGGDDVTRRNAFLVRERYGEAVSPIRVRRGEDLRGRDFSLQILTDVDLSEADLTSARFFRTGLRNASFRGANLTDANLAESDLRGTDFTGADLTHAWLLGADLTGADFRGSVLYRTKFVGATLDDGALDEAKLFGAALPRPSSVLPWYGSSSSCWAVAWSPDHAFVATGHDDAIVRLWDAASGQQIRRFSGHQGAVRSVVFSPDGTLLASGSYDQTVRLWNVDSGGKVREFTGHESYVSSVVFSPDGTLLASGSDDPTVCLWNVDSGEEARKFVGHENTVLSAAFSPDGTLLASGARDQTVRLWNVGSGEEARKLAGHESAVYSVAFSPDGTLLASGSGDQTVRLWNVDSGEEARKLAGHESYVSSVVFSPDGTLLASGSDDQTVRLWNVDSGGEARKLAGHESAVYSVVFSPDGTLLASGSLDQTVRLWNVASGEEARKLAGHGSSVESVAYSPDGTLLASGSLDQTVRLWNVASGEEARKLAGHENCIESVAFSPDGTLLASGSRDQTVRLWTVASGEEARKLAGHKSFVLSVAFSLDGALLASGSLDQTVRLWDVASGEEARKLTGHRGTVFSVAFSPEGTLLASGSDDQTVRLWNVASGEEVRKLAGHERTVLSVAFSPDGTLLASGSLDQTVRLWNVDSGEETRKLAGHEDYVESVVFSPDGTLLASGSKDQTVRLWDVASGRCLAILFSMPEGWVAYTPDGRYKWGGETSGGFWHSIGLCRFEPGELDPYLDEPLLVGAGERLF